jgi:hypothetical protein
MPLEIVQGSLEFTISEPENPVVFTAPPCLLLSAADEQYLVPEQFTEITFLSTGGAYRYKTLLGGGVAQCDWHVVDLLMSNVSNNPNYPQPGSGAPVQVDAGFFDLPSSKNATLDLPDIERDCESYELEIWHRVSRNVDNFTVGDLTLAAHLRKKATWDAADDLCTLYDEYNTFPSDWLIEKLDKSTPVYDRHRIAVRGKLRTTAQRVFVRVVAYPG